MEKRKWIPAILGVLLLVAEIVMNLFGSNIHILVWLAIVALLLQIAILQLELSDIKNTRPLIENDGLPFQDTRPLGREEFVLVDFFHQRFTNNPKRRVMQATAWNVYAELTYYDEGGRRLIGPIPGRWADSKQPMNRDIFTSNRDLLPINFAPSGLPQVLTVAMKYPEEDTIYACNNDSYHYKGWKNPAFVLDSEIILIHVLLKGDNVDDAEWCLLLDNEGKSQSISLIDCPELLAM